MERIVALFLFVFFLLMGCTSATEARNPDFIEPLQLEIPNELANNSELTAFIRSAEKDINSYSDNIELLVFEGMDILSKNTEDLDAEEKIRWNKMAVQFFVNSTKMCDLIESIQKHVENAKDNGFNAAQVASLEIVLRAIENRVTEIDNKYKNYFKYQ